MRTLLWVAVLAAAGALHGQPVQYITYLNPGYLYAGGSSTQISVYNQAYGAGLTAFWNGSPRKTAQSGSNSGSYAITLTAADLAVPQLAVITMIDPAGTVVDTTDCPVVYNVQPTGVAFDSGRNRLYIATPTQTGDARFPPNSVVALDLTTGSAGPILNVGRKLGDLALSDDKSALYVVVEDDSVVRRLDPATLGPVEDFRFRPVGYTPPYPGAALSDMLVVLPGKTDSVSLGYFVNQGYSSTEIAIFDKGVKRAGTIVANGFSSMLFSPDGKYFFQNGYTTYDVDPNAYDYQPVTFRYSVDATGFPKQTPSYAAGGGAAAIAGGTLYTSLATTIDYGAMMVTGSFGIGGPIAVDPANQRAFVLFTPPILDSSGSHQSIQLVAFSLPDLTPLGTQIVGITAATTWNDSKKLIRFGTDGFILPSSAGLLIFHSPLAGPAPSIAQGGVVNAASLRAGPIAPGVALTILGKNLGPATPAVAASSSSGAYPVSLGGSQVWFGETPGTMLMAHQGQINVIAPYDLQPGQTLDIQVTNSGIPSARLSLPVVSAAPALFTLNGSGVGPVMMVSQDGYLSMSAAPGAVVTLYGSGGGMASGAVDGAVVRRAATLAAPVSLSVAGRDAKVLYAGLVPGLVSGLFQLDIQIPVDAPPGTAAITVIVDGHESPTGATTLEIH